MRLVPGKELCKYKEQFGKVFELDDVGVVRKPSGVVWESINDNKVQTLDEHPVAAKLNQTTPFINYLIENERLQKTHFGLRKNSSLRSPDTSEN